MTRIHSRKVAKLSLNKKRALRKLNYEYCTATEGPVNMMDNIDVKKSHMPGLLTLNCQTRKEDLPISYSNNELRFGGCRAKFIVRWLFKAVQPRHLKFINAISWTSPLEITRRGTCGGFLE